MSAAPLTALVAMAAVAIVYVAGRLTLRRARPFIATAGSMLAALVGGFGLVLPAFLLFEPRHGGESFGAILPAAAGVGTILAAIWTGRAARMLLSTSRLTSTWKRGGRQLDARRLGLAATIVETGAPIVAVGGMVRPHLFVDRRVIEVCTPEELDAVAAHERAHVRSRDNLRRLLIGIASGPRSAASAAWRAEAELHADRQAVTSPGVALDLASALIKLSRMSQPRLADAVLMSSIHDGGSLEARVQRLLALSAEPTPPRSSPSRRWWLVAPLLVLLTPLGLKNLHAVVEILIQTLP